MYIRICGRKKNIETLLNLLYANLINYVVSELYFVNFKGLGFLFSLLYVCF